jgi:hypothetical protein
MNEEERKALVKQYLNFDETKTEKKSDMKWTINFNFVFTLLVIIFLEIYSLWINTDNTKEIRNDINKVNLNIDTVKSQLTNLTTQYKIHVKSDSSKTSVLYGEQCRVDSIQDAYLILLKKEIDKLK